MVCLSCFNGHNKKKKKDLEAVMGKNESGAETPLAHFLPMPTAVLYVRFTNFFILDSSQLPPRCLAQMRHTSG